MNKVPRRRILKDFLMSAFSMLFSSKAFANDAPSSIESRDKEVTIAISFKSLKNPNIIYNSIEDFWLDHDDELSASPFVESALSKLTFKRKRVLTKSSEDGTPYYEVRYKDKRTYLKHMAFLKRMYKHSVKRVSPTVTHYVHENYIAIDTII